MNIPAGKLHVSSVLSFEQLALVETLAIGCHAINRGNPQPGEIVLVIGAGPIGLSVLEFARLSGARTMVMDMNEDRLRFVRESMKLPETILARGDETSIAELLRLTDGRLADVVVDATGSNLSMSAALAYCAFAGRLVFVGITQRDLTFPHAPILHRRELTLLASRNALPADFTRIIHLIAGERLDTGPWITHRTSFEEVPTVFPSYLRPDSGVIKAMVSLN
jgi:alcohol dehydrogenase